jgi:5-methylcytosine-specific restriction endonuclease McrBC GTP-binding regulatory subunit McrB
VQALYRAGTPAFKDKPYVIVLDEMNLSHPEQYFADVLSAIERDAPLTLTNVLLEPAPSRLAEGRLLAIPSNVWFVGTANHDETTMGFADKTYDRSHVRNCRAGTRASRRGRCSPPSPSSSTR